MNVKLSEKEIALILEAINKMDYANSEFEEDEANEVWSKLTIAKSSDKVFNDAGIPESLNEDIQILDKYDELIGKTIKYAIKQNSPSKEYEYIKIVFTDKSFFFIKSDSYDEVFTILKTGTSFKNIKESLNEDIQLLDKVRYEKDRGYVIGQIEGKLLVQIQGNTVLVDPKDLQEWNKKPDLTTVPHMKFDEETQKLLFEQYVRCGVYHGNVPIKLNDCYVRYSHWEKASPDQQIKVLVEGNVTFMPKSQVRILEDLNDFANEDSYVPGVLVDEASGEAVENVLVHAIDYTSAIGDADSVRIIKKVLSGEQEIQTVPKAMVKTLAI